MSFFTDRTAIVTGSSRGIGLAVADLLTRAGANVVINARKGDEVDSTVEQLAGRPGAAAGLVANVRDDNAPAELAAFAIERFGRIDFVVNNAGASPYYGPLLSATRSAFELTMKVNAWAPLALVQAACEAGLGEHPGAAVVNISTIGAKTVQPPVGLYTASKAALEVLTRTLAREVGVRGIRVNAVAPGLVRTRMASALLEGDRESQEADLLPLQRLGEPEDIANAVVFLLSDAAAWMTGATLDVDGGRLLVGDESRDLIGVYDPAALVAG
jgi:NAD(P)-dependent dehydrogenase (short-subunit alcohol dehydrogenase family)